MYVKFKKHRQTRYPLWENVILIKARSDEDAFEKAVKCGREHEGDCSGTFRWGGKPARWVFAGIRQLITCDNPHKRPSDRSEVTYLELEVSSKRELKKLVDGEPAMVKMLDMRHEPTHKL
jgi:hypothetical protein